MDIPLLAPPSSIHPPGRINASFAPNSSVAFSLNIGKGRQLCCTNRRNIGSIMVSRVYPFVIVALTVLVSAAVSGK